MAVRILVVDDEPDLEILVVQKFRSQIRNNEMDFPGTGLPAGTKWEFRFM